MYFISLLFDQIQEPEVPRSRRHSLGYQALIKMRNQFHQIQKPVFLFTSIRSSKFLLAHKAFMVFRKFSFSSLFLILFLIWPIVCRTRVQNRSDLLFWSPDRRQLKLRPRRRFSCQSSQKDTLPQKSRLVPTHLVRLKFCSY